MDVKKYNNTIQTLVEYRLYLDKRWGKNSVNDGLKNEKDWHPSIDVFKSSPEYKKPAIRW